MRRNGHEQAVFARNPGQQQARHQLGKADPAPVLETKGKVSRNIPVSNGRMATVMIRRSRNARAANGEVRRQRAAATRASAPGQKIQLLPAQRAKLLVCPDDLSALGTSRRKGERQDLTQHNPHKPLVAPTLPLHKPAQ